MRWYFVLVLPVLAFALSFGVASAALTHTQTAQGIINAASEPSATPTPTPTATPAGPPSVGGDTEFLVGGSQAPVRASDGGGAAPFPFPAIAGTAAAAAAAALAAGGWCARRRWLR